MRDRLHSVANDVEEHGMRFQLSWPVSILVAAATIAGCGKKTESPPSGAAPAGAASGAAAPAGAASGAAAPAAAASGATTSCASKGELTMWERSGGNKDMVDMLVAAWNAKNPDCKIKLTYIPHTEMVGKIAQGIASGDVPDLMGMDLIYAPQFEKANQLVDITDQISGWSEL